LAPLDNESSIDTDSVLKEMFASPEVNETDQTNLRMDSFTQGTGDGEGFRGGGVGQR
jgi:hypothetical protein